MVASTVMASLAAAPQWAALTASLTAALMLGFAALPVFGAGVSLSAVFGAGVSLSAVVALPVFEGTFPLPAVLV